MIHGSIGLWIRTIKTLDTVGLFALGRVVIASLLVLVLIEADLLLCDRIMQRGSLAATGAVCHSVFLRPALSLNVVCAALDENSWVLAVDEALILQSFFVPIERSVPMPAVGFLFTIMEEGRSSLLDGENVRAFG